MKINILLIDDDEEVFKIFKKSLSDFFNISYFNKISDAPIESQGAFFDLIIIDLYLDNENSLEILAEYKMSRPELLKKTIVITATSKIDDEIESHTIGVRDYIKKPLNPKLLRAIIEKHIFALKGESNQVILYGPFELNLDEYTIRIKEESGQDLQLNLSPKEFLLLKYFLQNHDHVLSREKIMQDVWDYESDTMSRTIDMYISSLRKKIVPYDNYLITKHGLGYIFQKP